MSIIQALSHLFMILSGISRKNNLEKLIKEWQTVPGTVVDMIQFNPFFGDILKTFLERRKILPFSKAFLSIVEENLNEQDIQNFSTPNFIRVLTFCRKNEININPSDKLDGIITMNRKRIIEIVNTSRNP